jgi:hypothetical protein
VKIMALEALKAKLRANRARMTGQEGSYVIASPNGPAGFDLIDEIVKVLEEQQRQIDELALKK